MNCAPSLAGHFSPGNPRDALGSEVPRHPVGIDGMLQRQRSVLQTVDVLYCRQAGTAAGLAGSESVTGPDSLHRFIALRQTLDVIR
ncbi:hypothetical protein J6590_043747 [Homalodisca vitripennis]|nr:hypothetical protein J6590_043747 [Homalodisca vitripennis]